MTSEINNPVTHKKFNTGVEREIIHLDNLMVVKCTFTNGPAEKPDKPHCHPHEQITYVAEGRLKFFLGEEEKDLSEGELIAIEPGIFHSIQTLSKKVILVDSFSPVRQDFLENL